PRVMGKRPCHSTTRGSVNRTLRSLRAASAPVPDQVLQVPIQGGQEHQRLSSRQRWTRQRRSGLAGVFLGQPQGQLPPGVALQLAVTLKKRPQDVPALGQAWD